MFSKSIYRLLIGYHYNDNSTIYSTFNLQTTTFNRCVEKLFVIL